MKALQGWKSEAMVSITPVVLVEPTRLWDSVVMTLTLKSLGLRSHV